MRGVGNAATAAAAAAAVTRAQSMMTLRKYRRQPGINVFCLHLKVVFYRHCVTATGRQDVIVARAGVT